MTLEPHIFKAYDIRGKFPKEVDADGARKIGNAVAVFLSRKYKKKSLRLLVAGDVRTSTPVLKKALIEGMVMQGSDVVDAGVITTPLFYFLLRGGKYDGGVMVTASHNPREYNGFKVQGRNAEPIGAASGLKQVAARARRKSFARAQSVGRVSQDFSGIERYVALLKKGADIGNARVVIDAAGGCATFVLPKLLAKFPKIIYKPLFFKPDGTFASHDPNPLNPDAQEFIKEELRNGSFDFGVLFDSDGDRIVFFDERGNEIRGDFILGILAGELLKKNRGAWVIVDTNASWAVTEYITALGGKWFRAGRGYVSMTGAMRKKKAIAGGEISSHFFFREFGGNESSMYALLVMLAAVSRTAKKLSHILRPLQKYVSSPEINFSVRDKKGLLRAVEREFRAGGVCTKGDGITIEFSNWWFNLRPSNTEPLVRLTVEADSQEFFNRKKEELVAFIKRHS